MRNQYIFKKLGLEKKKNLKTLQTGIKLFLKSFKISPSRDPMKAQKTHYLTCK
jgi:hypothetical protein